MTNCVATVYPHHNTMSKQALIGFAGALAAPEVVWSLASHGFQITAFGKRGRKCPIDKSRFVRVEEITPADVDCQQSVQDITALAAQLASKSETPLVVMPLDDEAVWLCGKADLGYNTVLAGPRGQGVELALDKQKQIELARKAGFAVPATRLIQRREDAFLEPIRYPVVFKPSDAVIHAGNRLGKGRSWVCSDSAEMEAALQSWNGGSPMLLQEFIPGTGEGFFGIATPAGVKAWSRHRRVRMMNPHGSGASACLGVLEQDREMEAAGEKFVQSGGWKGLFMIELLRDEAGKLWFMEFNGRTWGSMALARRSGLEYPAWAAQLALDPSFQINPAARPAGQKPLLCRHLGRELVHLMFVLKGSRSRAITRWPSFWQSFFQVFRFGGDDRWYNWNDSDKAVFFNDVTTTVGNQIFRSKGSH